MEWIPGKVDCIVGVVLITVALWFYPCSLTICYRCWLLFPVNHRYTEEVKMSVNIYVSIVGSWMLGGSDAIMPVDGWELSISEAMVLPRS